MANSRSNAGPYSTRGIRAEKIRKANERNRKWLAEYLAEMTPEERAKYDADTAKMKEHLEAISSRHLPKRQRTRTIVKYGNTPEERVSLWTPPTRRK